MNTKRPYEGYRSESGRLTDQAIQPLIALKSDLPAEQAEGIHSFDLAHAVMLIEAAIIPPEIGRPILSTLSAIPPDRILEARVNAGGGIHSGEQLLIRELGLAFGGYLHIGRSSGDLGETSKRIALRQHIQMIARALAQLRLSLMNKARAHLSTVMPAFTHGLHAQPTTFGHFLLMHEAGFSRDSARILESYDRINRSPAGAAIMTGSDFPINRQRVSDLLGFLGPIPHTMDAILSHDVDTEYASVLAILAQDLARLSDDLMQFSTNEAMMIELADRHCGTSSIMPQKKNPDILEHIKAVSGEALGAVTMMAVNERGPSGWPVLERRDNHRVLWGLGEKISQRLFWMADVIDGLVVHEERTLFLANAHWSTATDLASLLVKKGGLDWRSAHGLVGKVVKYALDNELAPSRLNSNIVSDIAQKAGLTLRPISDTSVHSALDATTGVERRDLLGGPSSQSMMIYVEEGEQRLVDARDTINEMSHRDDHSRNMLAAAVKSIIGE